MAFRAPFFLPQTLPQPIKFQTHLFSSVTPLNNRGKTQFSSKKRISDAELAADLAEEMARVNTHSIQRKEAMKKSRELLFGDFCQYLGLTAEEVKKRWRRVDEEQKLGLVKGFVSEWGAAFHPLSSRSVKELVEEHLADENPNPISSPSFIFPGLKRIMGFSPE